jgi:hypothetical protein
MGLPARAFAAAVTRAAGGAFCRELATVWGASVLARGVRLTSSLTGLMQREVFLHVLLSRFIFQIPNCLTG